MTWIVRPYNPMDLWVDHTVEWSVVRTPPDVRIDTWSLIALGWQGRKDHSAMHLNPGRHEVRWFDSFDDAMLLCRLLQAGMVGPEDSVVWTPTHEQAGAPVETVADLHRGRRRR